MDSIQAYNLGDLKNQGNLITGEKKTTTALYCTMVAANGNPCTKQKKPQPLNFVIALVDYSTISSLQIALLSNNMTTAQFFIDRGGNSLSDQLTINFDDFFGIGLKSITINSADLADLLGQPEMAKQIRNQWNSKK